MFEHPNLLTILLILLTFCALIYLIKEIYYFSLDLNQEEESKEGLEGESSESVTIPLPEEFLGRYYNNLRKKIAELLAAGNTSYLPEFPGELYCHTLALVLAEVEEKGYIVKTEKNNVDGRIYRVTFSVREGTKRLPGVAR